MCKQIEEYPKEAGYPVGGDFVIKYYVIQIHYDNPKRASSKVILLVDQNDCIIVLLDRRDTSGIHFYLGNELRQHDVGFLTFGTSSDPSALAIPPHVDKFNVDSYCLPNSTRV